ncbi:hypothetical protein AOQ84DRAFT_352533 [Glonium stellatum]|uniref:FAD-binding FR-type domain-containing protein n=1 Tax=Glonium stellatum TaxID=574774 RepID=A0A8E2F9M3_9PEZI|nr:hypothetical protein AOQ84DRAFT_352533 [Glonium stellatum]
MAFGYEFVILNEPEKEQRRYLLGLYSTIAQWSALGVFIFFQAYFLLCWFAERSTSEPPKSPFGRPGKLKSRTWARKFQQALQQVSWWTGKSVRRGWGTRGEWIAGLAWTVWLLFLSIHNTGDDFLHLTKRFGIVGASQLPLHYMLAIKSPYSPIQLITRLSHEQLKVSHQIMGRIIYFLFALHASFYLYFFVQSGFLAQRIRDLDVITGLISITMFTILSTTALEILRRWSYRVFYTTHIILAGLLLEPLFLHVTHIRPYLAEIVAIIVLHEIVRNYSVRRYSGMIGVIPGTNLVEIRIPLISTDKELTWKPGQHVYLSRPTGVSSSSWYESFVTRYRVNPFTIASLPAKDKQLLLVTRTLSGNTKSLADLARSLSAEVGPGETSPSIPIALEGPYGASVHLPDLSKFDRVLLVAGGVGATFLVPVYRSMIEGEGVFRSANPQIRFVWAVRKLAETQWALPSPDGDETESDVTQNAVEVYITRPSGANLQLDNTGDNIELAEAEQLMPFQDETEKARRGMTVHVGRPDIGSIADEVFTNSFGSVAVLACGPQIMTEELRERVGKWVKEGRDVYWHCETFGW